jgi:hypothetical protein
MSDETITELFARYRAAYEAGEDPDMAAMLAEAGADAALLAAVVEEYHATSPAPLDFDAIEAFAASPAFAPTFGEVLRAAWTQHGMLRRVLVDRLIVELGLRPEARGRLDQRLHQVETGQHSSRQVSNRLLGALDRILPGVSGALTAAGDGPPIAGRAGRARYARQSDEPMGELAAHRAYASAPAPLEYPEVDELFQAD